MANPGSLIAIRAGCCCPVVNNNRGLGVVNNLGVTNFFIAKDCPIHSFLHTPETSVFITHEVEPQEQE